MITTVGTSTVGLDAPFNAALLLMIGPLLDWANVTPELPASNSAISSAAGGGKFTFHDVLLLGLRRDCRGETLKNVSVFFLPGLFVLDRWPGRLLGDSTRRRAIL
ncbi:MAG: hypothetical protein KGP08_11595, partial [Xanthomonadaceae bacterium]|nr:hypothetical protein [Xanthomonadaceae bacterium]